MIKEFKAFIERGNVLEFAVAVIMAGAFGNIITSFTNDILMPPIGLAMGDVDFTSLKYVLKEGTAAVMSGDAVVTPAIEEVAIRWGQWLKYVVDFIIIAFLLFIIVRAYNKSQKPPEEEAAAGPSQEDLLTEIRDLLKK